MNHPPETSRELVQKIAAQCVPGGVVEEAVALIDAWIRVREAQVLEEAVTAIGSVYSGMDAHADGVLNAAQNRVRAFATARKHLGERNV